jgi:hypothetical protein
LIVEWSLGEIEGYHLLKDFDPESLCMITPVNNLVTDQVWISRNIVLSFDYPQIALANSFVKLKVTIRNQGSKKIELELKQLRAADFMWIGKSTIFEDFEPNVSTIPLLTII